MRYLSILILVLLPAMVFADYVPSGPYRFYNAEVDSSRVASGGPLRNYNDNGTWRTINPAFRLDGGKLVSDSGRHGVEADLSTNIVRLDWKGHILRLEVAPLFAYRRSVATRWKLADPNFTTRSYSDNTILIENIYPNVDLRIVNDPDGLKHSYTFHQAARDAFETWWQNNGAYDDIYIVNAIRLDVDSLGLSWTDSTGGFDLTESRDITGAVRLKLGAATRFFLRPTRIQPDTTDEWAVVYKRIIVIGGNPYLVEGFKWSTVRTWSDGDIYHDAEFGGKGNSGSNLGIVPDDKYASIFTMGASEGTMDSIYISAKRIGGTNDSITLFVYDDSSAHGGTDTVPAALIATADGYVVVSSSGYENFGTTISGSVSASTDYFLGGHNSNESNCYFEGTATATYDEVEETDPLPLSDPFGSLNDDNQYSMNIWVVYTVAGDGAVGQIMRLTIQ